MKELFDAVSSKCSMITTKSYSTSFSLGIKFLNKRFHDPIYGIYGFVRLADEIVDSFHGYDKDKLLQRLKHETFEAINQGISLNPILNSFQAVVRKFGIEKELILTFLKSMEMDLDKKNYNQEGYEDYIFGSAEAVGLMCLRVFTEGNNEQFDDLKPAAMKLGAAFQKVNFLRDLQADYGDLGRTYFPGLDIKTFSAKEKQAIEKEISEDFKEALEGIKHLPTGARQGVYLAYVYYNALFLKIQEVPAEKVMKQRIRIPNPIKFTLMLNSVVRYRMNAL
jgi:phytoene/squalene synthetase